MDMAHGEGMRRILLTMAALLLATGTAKADRWTKADTVVQASFTALLAMDYVQTRQIVRDGQEVNPMIGAHGELVPPAMYLASVAVIHAGVVLVLPQPYRRIAQGVGIACEVEAVGTNLSFGYGFSF